MTTTMTKATVSGLIALAALSACDPADDANLAADDESICSDEDPERAMWVPPLPVGDKPASPRDCLRLDEVFVAPRSTAPGMQWVEIRNRCAVEVALEDVWIQYTRPIYGWVGGFVPVHYLEKLAPGACVTVGGPMSSEDNGLPNFELVSKIDPPMLLGDEEADAVGLFILEDKAPFDAVLYGAPNTRELLDETGKPGEVDIEDVPEGFSLQRGAGGWTIGPPSPDNCK